MVTAMAITTYLSLFAFDHLLCSQISSSVLKQEKNLKKYIFTFLVKCLNKNVIF